MSMKLFLDWGPSTLLTCTGFVLFWMAGNNDPRTWKFGLWTEVLWISYGFWLHQFGLLVGAVGFSAIYLRNHFKQKRENVHVH